MIHAATGNRPGEEPVADSGDRKKIWREPVRGSYPDPRIFQLSGMDQLRSCMVGGWPRPPMSHLTGLSFSHADETETMMEQPASGWFLSSQGVIPGGFLAIVADAAFGAAITSRLPARTPFTTSEISLNFIKPATPRSRILRARGTALHVGRDTALAECVVEDGDGTILAHGTTRCVILDQLPPVDGGDGAEISLQEFLEASPPNLPVDYDSPSPYLRPVKGEPLSAATWEELSGREILERQIAGELQMPPIHHLTGMRPTAVGDGQATFVLPCTAWLTSGFGTIQGGFGAMLAYSALASAIQSTTEAGTAHLPVDLKVNYVRPAYPDPSGRDLYAEGRVVHRGRSLRVADAEVCNPDGKLVAVARGTSMLLPGQSAWAAA
ncbi:MAG: PaaI family thioesterase [Candidatus Dormiibacterota bacterium]